MIKIARLPAYHFRKGAPGLLVESWALGELLSFQYPWVDSPRSRCWSVSAWLCSWHYILVTVWHQALCWVQDVRVSEMVGKAIFRMGGEDDVVTWRNVE